MNTMKRMLLVALIVLMAPSAWADGGDGYLPSSNPSNNPMDIHRSGSLSNDLGEIADGRALSYDNMKLPAPGTPFRQALDRYMEQQTQRTKDEADMIRNVLDWFKGWFKIKMKMGGMGDPFDFSLPGHGNLDFEFSVGPKTFRSSQPDWIGWTKESHGNYDLVERFVFDLNGDGVKDYITHWPVSGMRLFLDIDKNNEITNGGEMFWHPRLDVFQVINRMGLDTNKDGRLTKADKSWKLLRVLDMKTNRVYTPDELKITFELDTAHNYGNDSDKYKGRYSYLRCYKDDWYFRKNLKAGLMIKTPFPANGKCIRFVVHNRKGVELTNNAGKTSWHSVFGTVLGAWKLGVR